MILCFSKTIKKELKIFVLNITLYCQYLLSFFNQIMVTVGLIVKWKK